MEDFHNLQSPAKDLQERQSNLKETASELSKEVKQDSDELEDLKERVNILLESVGEEKRVEFDECTLEELNSVIDAKLKNLMDLSDADRNLRMNPVDYVVAAMAGGIAVIVDFLLVKIPKSDKYLGKYDQEGSPLTALLRKIGADENGKVAALINNLEDFFHVNYDPSVREGIYGPRNHRTYSPGHDPSPSGLIFAVKDILSGTFTYFDKSGRLVIEKAEEMGLLKKCFAPFMWFGHLISDLFTSAGIPVPGGTLLRAIQIGEFGPKGRTFGELIDWMYIRGYDMRHLATMSTANGAMNLIIALYLAFLSPLDTPDSQLLSEKEFVEVRNNEKKVRMKFVASSVAVAGNVAKICAYQGNPSAFNYSLWYEMIKHAIGEVIIHTKDTSAEDAIERRHVLDENFEILLATTK